MRVGLGSFMHPTNERLRFIKQLGVDDVLLNMYRTPLIDTDYGDLPFTGDDEWSFKELVKLRNRVEDAGLRLNAIENLPHAHYEKVMLGEQGREEQIEHVKNTIRNIGAAGIPTLGYHWMPSGVWRTSTTYRVRGGAQSMAVDMDDIENAPLTHGREYTEAEMWDNYEWFLNKVIPVAEDAGVTLAVHPNDPPVESLGGIAQLFRSFENYKRAMDLVDSDNHAVQFCLGNWSKMGADIPEVIRYFGERDKIAYVHSQTVSSPLPKFHEVFVDQKGYYDPSEILDALADVGFSGMLIPGHVPKVEGDGPWNERGRAFTVGYLNGMIDEKGIEGR
jgi:mannonate dehydratase